MFANIYLFIPKTYYIEKSLYLLNNFFNIFEKFDHTIRMPDEDLLFYTVYPNWSEKQINVEDIKYNFERLPNIDKIYINRVENRQYEFNIFVRIKPFMYSYNNNNTMFTANHSCYDLWDNAIKKILTNYPQLHKYVDFIKTFRYTNF